MVVVNFFNGFNNNLTSQILKLSFNGIQRFTSSISISKAFCLMPFNVPIVSSPSFNKLFITTCCPMYLLKIISWSAVVILLILLNILANIIKQDLKTQVKY